jgi:hypothetical protein
MSKNASPHDDGVWWVIILAIIFVIVANKVGWISQ